MKLLTEILPGAWYDADQITAIQAYESSEPTWHRVIWWRDKPAEKPSVRAFFKSGYKLDYDYDTHEKALEAASKAAAIVNAARKVEE